MAEMPDQAAGRSKGASTTVPQPNLALLQTPLPLALLNTVSIDRQAVHDGFADVAGVAEWLGRLSAQVGMTPTPVIPKRLSSEAVSQLVDLRDAARRLAAEETNDPRSLGQSPVLDVPRAIAIINGASAAGRVWPELELVNARAIRRDSWTGDSTAQALTSLLARQTIELVASAEWKLLRACTAPSCARYFFKVHFRREWCSALCGNRARVARHAQRRHV